MRVVLDFETFWDKDYSLKKMSTSEYVRDPRFELQLCVVSIDGEHHARWGLSDAAQYLECLPWREIDLVGHHLQFDGFILAEKFNLYPRSYQCTVSASRCVLQNMVQSHDLDTVSGAFGLRAKSHGLKNVKGIHLVDMTQEQRDGLLEYCHQDVANTDAIHTRLWPGVPEQEKQLIDWTIRAFCKSRLHVDVPRARAALDETIEQANRIINRVDLGRETLRSDKKLAKALEKIGYPAPTKTSPKTGKKAYAFAKTDDGLKNMLVSEREDIRLVAQARLAAKSTIDETRANRLVQMGITGNLAVYLNYWGAHTGRWSGGNKMNLQNFRRGSELRKSIIAPPGYVIGVGDSSQIEVRKAAWLMGDEAVIQAFRDFDAGVGPDIYKVTASGIYEKPIDQISDDERFIGKTSRLGLQFGMGWKKYQVTLALGSLGPPVFIPADEAARIVYAWRAANPKAVEYWQWCEHMLALMAGRVKGVEEVGGVRVDGEGQTIWLPSGRWLRYSGLHRLENNYIYYRNGKPIYTYGGKLTENIVQAVARDVVAAQMLVIDERYDVVSMTHDEILTLIPEGEAEEGLAWMLEVMRTPPSWCSGLPLNAEGKVAKEYSK